MIKINLVPEEILAKELRRQRAVQAGVVAGCVVAAVVVLSLAHVYRASRLDRVLKERNQEFDKLQKIVAQVEELERTAAAVKSRLGVITDLLKGRSLYPVFMMDLAGTLPSDVWLTALTTTPKEGNQLNLSMTATSRSGPGIAEWMRGLTKSGLFAEPVLGAVAVSEAESVRLHAFTLTTTYKNPKF